MATSLRLRAECPLNSWDRSFEIQAALYGVDGELLGAFSTETPTSKDKATVSREDNYTANYRHRTIDLDMIATSYRAKVAMIVLGMTVATTTTLSEFEQHGYGRVKLSVTGKDLEDLDIFEFPLGYSVTSNAQILGSLVQALSTRDESTAHKSVSLNTLNRWRLKFGTNTLHGTITDLVPPMEAEFRLASPLIHQNDLAGCLPLSDLYKARKQLVDRISALPLKEEKRESPESGGHPCIDQNGALIVPLDRLSADIKRIWDRQNMQDDNLRDLWTVVNALNSELKIADNELNIVDRLAQRMESFETLMLDMFYGTTNLVRNIREAMELTNGQDLSEETIRGMQREKLGTLFDIQTENADVQKAIETMGRYSNFRKCATLVEKSMRRSDLYDQPCVRTSGNRLQHLLDTVSARPSPHSLAAGIGNTLIAIDRPEATYPEGLPAAYTLNYDL